MRLKARFRREKSPDKRSLLIGLPRLVIGATAPRGGCPYCACYVGPSEALCGVETVGSDDRFRRENYPAPAQFVSAPVRSEEVDGKWRKRPAEHGARRAHFVELSQNT